MTDKATESVKPDSEKTYLEQAKETVTSATDSVAKNFQADDTKSGTQSAADKLTR